MAKAPTSARVPGDVDVLIVGAGPAGSSMATLLARGGASVALLDKAVFPRDKVCGDGLTPQALYWLDRLGCIGPVLDRCRACITGAEVVINGVSVLTGAFPQDSLYPGFSTLLERRVLDDVLVRHAVRQGAAFQAGAQVVGIRTDRQRIVADTLTDGKPRSFRAKLLVGADGVNSIVSRAIGNDPRRGTTAIAVRGYFEKVRAAGSQMAIYFGEQFFPGYGWLFVDDEGKANVGIGLTADRTFPLRRNVRAIFDDFVRTDLAAPLRGAVPRGRPAGWWASFSRPKAMVSDRIMLIGDAAGVADPMNGGGIHMAMENAFAASSTALAALAGADCSRAALQGYVAAWNARNELAWRTGDLCLTLAKNPHLREVYLMLMARLAGAIRADAGLEKFCGGIFSGVIPADRILSPGALFDALPVDAVWRLLLKDAGAFRAPALLHAGVTALRLMLASTGRIAGSPLANLEWGLEAAAKLAGLADCAVRRGTPAATVAGHA
jgi:menaquinone-9 beta-reductase